MKIPLKLNTITNYIYLLMRLCEGILIVRWIVSMLGKEVYGLWGVLWSLFAYTILLDFGFGTTAEKYTANDMPHAEPRRYSRIISTIFSFHVLMGMLIAVIVWGLSYYTNGLFHLHDAPVATQQLAHHAFLFFGLGSALIFPTSIFRGILVGLHKIYIRNYIKMTQKVIEFIGVVLIFLTASHFGWSVETNFMALIALMLGLTALANLVMWFYIRKLLPTVTIFLGFTRESFKDIFSFSGYVYAMSLASLLSAHASAILVATFCGLAQSGDFQIGRRFPLLMQQLTVPFQENASPLSARLCAHKKFTALGEILLGFMRWNSLISTGLAVLIAVMTPEIILFFFNVVSAPAVMVCRIMLASLWISLVLYSVPYKALTMANEFKTTTFATWLEALLSIGLNCLLLGYFRFSIVSVVIVALSVKLVIAICLLQSRLLTITHLSWWRLIRQVVMPPLLAGALTGGVAIGCKIFLSTTPLFWQLAIIGIISALVYASAIWLLALSPSERHRTLQFLKKK